jgi:hypothetical protein
MSKPWKIILAVGIVVVIIGLCLGGLAGLGFNRMQNFAMVNRVSQVMPNSPATDRFSRFEGRGRFSQDTPRQLEVQLIDDDEDGIPDRGVVDLPADYRFAPGGRFGSGPGRGFMPDARPNDFPDYRFGPFFILGALFRLAVLGVVIVGAFGLGLVLYHRWRPAPPAPAAATAPESPSPAPEAGAVTEFGEPEEDVAADTSPEAPELGSPDETGSSANPPGGNLEDESSSGSEADTSKA